MRHILLFSFLFLFGSNLFSAPAKPTPEVYQMLRVIENGMKVWKQVKLESLSAIVPKPFAENAWRIVLERPFETAPVEGLPDPQNKRGMRNNAEIILVKRFPGADPAKIRTELRWQVSPNELYTAITYLGEASGLYCYAKADIVTLDWLHRNLRVRNGDNPAEFIAEALNRDDENSFSRKSALLLIGAYGNSAIPHIRRAIGIGLAERDSIAPHLKAMKAIGTPEAVNELRNAVKSGHEEAVVGVLDALSEPPFLASAKDLYFMMIKRHYHIASAIEAGIQFKWSRELLPYLNEAAKTPHSFQEYLMVMTTIDQFIRNSDQSPELGYMEQIKLLLTRSGDLQGTPRILSLSDKATAVAAKLNKEDLARVKPFEDALVQSTNKNMAIVAALSLYVYDPGTGGMVSKDFVKRVRQSGARILTRLDRETVRRVLMTLKRNVESEDESNLFSSLAARLSRI